MRVSAGQGRQEGSVPGHGAHLAWSHGAATLTDPPSGCALRTSRRGVPDAPPCPNEGESAASAALTAQVRRDTDFVCASLDLLDCLGRPTWAVSPKGSQLTNMLCTGIVQNKSEWYIRPTEHVCWTSATHQSTCSTLPLMPPLFNAMNILRECPNPYAVVRAAIDAYYASQEEVAPKPGPWSLADYGIDTKSAFFPPEPLPTLPPAYHAWEEALHIAPDVLRLGTDKSPDALALRDAGEEWRRSIRSVSTNLFASR